ncbi:MAG TPA: 2-succinyl-5-enolpyruvyl-6-hydroxy-3-cyclohexene-1-carboxylic-acid synthase [Intrasporangium sp.]|uniref:2-succinyl-5-enolpyruvyl-6-hydroxy-3- cyclohexene-1-carboxylic-acid synthase n=1 Tax=Intrasporangium sp. TaxID=1925024 RepID=UPI002B4907D6|nr:2-succinyl-5-enolpyruvyl-6-hydroxy-3-cyclohexene-1-carboxylic-acid synthase [Intrasporangium sp.]HKX66518.1 2-succinyl-5-enolpyruvyl-6-hydroxy-3-cyclohexene-1-carboxylic-acid synthase [Intrasporangium sp.]
MPLSSLPAHGAFALSLALVQALWARGVRDVVLAPGSRSAPLALVLHRADAAGDLRLHVRVDERSAGFLALGLATGSRRPVAVVTTSGTAVGNLLPAVMEAHHTGRPVVVVSADRPERLRGTGSNQTTVQAGIFGRFAPCVDLAPDVPLDAIAAAVDEACRRVGPSQLNVQLDADLMPPDPEPATWWSRTTIARAEFLRPEPAGSRSDFAPAEPLRLDPGPRTVVVAGDDAGPAARILAEAANWPLLAEPTSGARIGRQAIRTYRLLLGTGLRDEIERVIVIGHPTLSRPVTSLVTDPALDVISVRDRTGTATDPGRVATIVDAVPTVDAPPPTQSSVHNQPPPTQSSVHNPPPPSQSSVHHSPDWFDRWRAADDALSARIDEHLASRAGSPLAIATVVADAVTAHTTLVVGSSNVVRDLDVMATPWPPHEHRFVVGNRGLAGIDGTVSTAVGIALGREGASRTIAYLGDLTLLHDANGLLIGPDEPRPDLTFVVLNDDGGAIFAGLEQGATAYAPAFERVFGTPHDTDLAALCRAHGIAHERITQPERLAAALGSEPSGIRLIEVPVSRAERRAEADHLRDLAQSLWVRADPGPATGSERRPPS